MSKYCGPRASPSLMLVRAVFPEHSHGHVFTRPAFMAIVTETGGWGGVPKPETPAAWSDSERLLTPAQVIHVSTQLSSSRWGHTFRCSQICSKLDLHLVVFVCHDLFTTIYTRASRISLEHPAPHPCTGAGKHPLAVASTPSWGAPAAHACSSALCPSAPLGPTTFRPLLVMPAEVPLGNYTIYSPQAGTRPISLSSPCPGSWQTLTEKALNKYFWNEGANE